jgi:hypothetical protein
MGISESIMKLGIALMSFIPGVTLTVCSAVLEIKAKPGWPWFLGFGIFFMLLGLNFFDKKT